MRRAALAVHRFPFLACGAPALLCWGNREQGTGNVWFAVRLRMLAWYLLPKLAPTLMFPVPRSPFPALPHDP
jgi:hypothetical protein